MGQNEIILVVLVSSYLLGSLPFGYWLVLRWKGIDIRTVGSGNIGSTNVGRVCGPTAAGIVWVLDVLKGLLPPLIATRLHLESIWQILAALLAIVGHNYSVWLNFKGGKGISTSLGGLIGVAPPVGIAAGLLWVALVLTLRYVSVASMTAALSLLFLMPFYYHHDTPRLIFAFLACFMAVYKHRANIERLRQGSESRVKMPWTKHEPTAAPDTDELPSAPASEKDTAANASR